MNDTAKSKSHVEIPPDLDAITDDLATLKRDFAILMNHLKAGGIDAASEAAHNAMGRFGDEASQIYENLSSQSKRSAKAVSEQVEEHPLISLLVAFVAGWCASRLLSR